MYMEVPAALSPTRIRVNEKQMYSRTVVYKTVHVVSRNFLPFPFLINDLQFFLPIWGTRVHSFSLEIFCGSIKISKILISVSLVSLS